MSKNKTPSSLDDPKKTNPGSSGVKDEGKDVDDILLPKPLLVPEIAEKILDYLDDPEFKLLKSLENLNICKGVCPLWKAICAKRRDAFDETHLTIPAPSKKNKLTALLEDVTSYNKNFILTLDPDWCPALLKSLIETIGSQIRDLAIWVEAEDEEEEDDDDESDSDEASYSSKSKKKRSKDQSAKRCTLKKIDKIVSLLSTLSEHASNLRYLKLVIEIGMSSGDMCWFVPVHLPSTNSKNLPFGFSFPPSTKFNPPSLKKMDINLPVKKLALSCDHVEYLDLFKKVVDSCPRMEKLEIGGEMYSVEPLLKHLMKDEARFSRLKELNLQEAASRDLSRAQRFTAFYSVHSWPLESLKLSVENNTIEFIPRMLAGVGPEGWKTRNGKLKELTLSFSCVRRDYPGFDRSLASNDNVMSSIIPPLPTLRRVTVSEAHSIKWVLINILRLPGIREANLKYGGDSGIVVSKSFPQLMTELHLTGKKSTVESLVLPGLSDPSIFPPGPQNPWVNLKNLEVSFVGRPGIQAILNSLTTLERLNLHIRIKEDKKQLDEIFTGSKKPADFNISKWNEYMAAANDSATSIRKFTLLKSLEINCDGKFSDWFIANGLVHLKHLQALVIEPDDEFSDEAVAVLKKNLHPFCRFSVQGQKNPQKGKE